MNTRINPILCISVCMIALLTLASFVEAQQISPRPSWLDANPLSTTFLPPEYTGSYADNVKVQFMTAGSHANSKKGVSLRGSSTSGILSILDIRPSASQRSYGWNTAQDRIHSICTLPANAGHAHRFLILCFNTTDKKCRILKIEFPVTGDPTQQIVGPVSLANALWTTGRMLGDKFYFYNAQSHTIRRVTDANQDGTLDTLDPSYLVSVPQNVKNDPVAVAAHPLLSLVRQQDGKIRVNGVTGKAHLTVEDVGGVKQLVLASTGDKPLIRIDNGLLLNQRRVCIYGTSGVEFRICRENPGGSDVPISSTWTIPSARWVVVDLKHALKSNWKIRALPQGGDAEPTRWHRVSAIAGVALFQRPLSINGNQGDGFTFEGEGFGPDHEICWSNDLGNGALQTTFETTHQLTATLPILGNASAEPPYQNYALTLFWVKNKTTGLVVSDRISMMVRYD